uniref:Uncharacterized protein n=1 Tax=Strongyloides venezuelensis TaxID=75913 RepID=A0A0K0FC50_STRVS
MENNFNTEGIIGRLLASLFSTIDFLSHNRILPSKGKDFGFENTYDCEVIWSETCNWDWKLNYLIFDIMRLPRWNTEYNLASS